MHKHADADSVNVVFERRDGHAVLIIEDNGKGYEGQPDGPGMGLINMRERAALIGGVVKIESQPARGTTIFVRVPIGVMLQRQGLTGAIVARPNFIELSAPTSPRAKPKALHIYNFSWMTPRAISH